VRALDRTGFSDVSFCGEYPIGYVEYRDTAVPVAVSLEAFSPFIPLSPDDSALPATVMRFTLKNTGGKKVAVELAGWLENAVCINSAAPGDGSRRNRLKRGSRLTLIESSAVPAPRERKPRRPDIVFEDFEKPTYEGWTVTGTAFGSGPVEKKKIPSYQGDVGGEGKRVVNSHASAPGNEVGGRDNATGKLVSREFKIERRFVSFYIGGGNHAGKTCLNLVVDGKVARTMTGKADNQMSKQSFDVRDLEGKTARFEIVDDKQGAWGNIGVDQIVFTDDSALAGPLEKRPDFGTMALACLGDATGVVSLSAGNLAEEIFPGASGDTEAEKPFGQKLVGALKRKLTLAPGKSATVTFLIAWHFPNHKLEPVRGSEGRRYAARFANATAVAQHLAKNFGLLVSQTRLWHDTWYDSTLPFWFLNRTMLNTSILASATCHWFSDGRFYGWEGVGCCAGTCTHVWGYAHAVGRLFPQLERDLRERTDYGLAFSPETGLIKFRGEGAGLAIDGQCNVILRSLREHQVSADDKFLKRNWPKIKRALQHLIEQDGGASGVLTGSQHNTLDTNWHGPVAWLTSLYLAALRAGEEMAREAGDGAFAAQCRGIFEKGFKGILDLFDGEYFINKPDPKHPEAINSGTGCEIDQVFGQSWAWQVGLGRVLPEKETLAALRSLWRYNFSPDVGPYREAMKPGRWYAMAGEAGLLMCSFPRTDWDYRKAAGKGPEWAAGYFNECMNGFEYQVASHMVWEGMLTEGLAITRALHDRYHPSRRNPWNEVECGDHYARSMASYGVFLAACGFEYHGPEGHIAFAPRLTPENFRAPFTSAEGWGTFSQKAEGGTQKAEIAVKHGKLRIKSLALAPLDKVGENSVKVTLNCQPVAATLANEHGKLQVRLTVGQTVNAGQKLKVEIR
ncbi:MAG: GH116 family glycosyl hydrolase, partial [Verrucomicrobia bacterium]|nr:GH116 family glycosyl hydrolase [Verrucomicrobiota bacterium]